MSPKTLDGEVRWGKKADEIERFYTACPAPSTKQDAWHPGHRCASDHSVSVSYGLRFLCGPLLGLGKKGYRADQDARRNDPHDAVELESSVNFFAAIHCGVS